MIKQNLETRFCILVVNILNSGGNIRATAKMFGFSKSTFHRHLPAIKAIAAEASQMGHASTTNDKITRLRPGNLSQMGQGGAA